MPTWQVGASSDDCHRMLNPDGYSPWSLTRINIAVGSFGGGTSQAGGGMRFTNITIPQGSNITSAYLTLRSQQTLAGTVVRSRISAEDVDDALTFADSAAAFDARWAARTTARVDWDNIPEWTLDVDYNSPEIKTVIQEIVDRLSWVSGNDIVIFWDDFDGRTDLNVDTWRYAYSYDGSTTYAPKLVVTYTGIVTSQLTRIHDVEGALTLTSIGGGAGASANNEIIIQAAQSAGRKQSNTTDHGFWLTATSKDVSSAGVHIGIWVNHIHYAVLTKLATRFGSDTSNWHEHTFPLTAQYPKTGGWTKFWVDVSRTPEAQAGTFNKAALTQVALLASLPAVGGNAPNLIMDASDFTTAGLLLTGASRVFQDILTADEGTGVNRYGVVISQSGVIYCFARLTLGSERPLAFDDDSFVIVFPNQSRVASNFMGVTVDLQNVSTTIAWDNGVLKSAGTVKGDLVVTGTAGAFTLDNMTLASLRIVTLTSKVTIDSCIISDCGLITPAQGKVLNSTILGTSDADKALFWNEAVDTNTRLDGTSFVSGGTKHGIEFGANTPTTITLTNVGFSGYGAGETANAAIYNNSGHSITINIAGGDTPTVRNGAGASTTVQSSVTLTVRKVKTGNEPTDYVSCSIYKKSDMTQIMNAEANVTDDQNTGFYKASTSYTATGIEVIVRAREKGWLPFELETTIPSGGLDVTAIWIADPNYGV